MSTAPIPFPGRGGCQLFVSVNGGCDVPCARSTPRVVIGIGERVLVVSFLELGMALEDRPAPSFCKAYEGISKTIVGYKEFVRGVEDIQSWLGGRGSGKEAEFVQLEVTHRNATSLESVVLRARSGWVSLSVRIDNGGCEFFALDGAQKSCFFIKHDSLALLTFSEEEICEDVKQHA